jgi:hypothetical protein
MTFEEFKKNTNKVSEHRVHKITGSLGVYDAFKWIRKNKWLDIGQSLTESEFYSIIRNVNLKLAELLAEGETITFPCRMGKLELRKKPVIKKLVNGKLKTNLPIDWDKTLKLWFEDKECYENKTLVHSNTNEMIKVMYDKRTANYNNKQFYKFNINRELKNSIRNNAKHNNIIAFSQYEE